MKENETTRHRRFEFENAYGEPIVLEVDLADETAILSSTDFGDVEIANDRIQNPNLILADDEFAFVSQAWRRVFGRELRELPFTMLTKAIHKLQNELSEAVAANS